MAMSKNVEEPYSVIVFGESTFPVHGTDNRSQEPSPRNGDSSGCKLRSRDSASGNSGTGSPLGIPASVSFPTFRVTTPSPVPECLPALTRNGDYCQTSNGGNSRSERSGNVPSGDGIADQENGEEEGGQDVGLKCQNGQRNLHFRVDRKRSTSLPDTSKQLATIAMTMCDEEEEDLYAAVTPTEDTGPFSSFGALSEHPAYLACLVRYLFEDGDCSERDQAFILFHIMLVILHRRRMAQEKRNDDALQHLECIASGFLSPNGPLCLGVDQDITSQLQIAMLDRSPSEAWCVLEDLERTVVVPRLEDCLEGFNNCRSLGFGSLYGEDHIGDGIDVALEGRVAGVILQPLLNTLSVTVQMDIHSTCRASDAGTVLTLFLASMDVAVSPSNHAVCTCSEQHNARNKVLQALIDINRLSSAGNSKGRKGSGARIWAGVKNFIRSRSTSTDRRSSH